MAIAEPGRAANDNSAGAAPASPPNAPYVDCLVPALQRSDDAARATDWPAKLTGCRFGFQHPEMAWPDDDGAVAMLQRLRYAVVAWLRARFG